MFYVSQFCCVTVAVGLFRLVQHAGVFVIAGSGLFARLYSLGVILGVFVRQHFLFVLIIESGIHSDAHAHGICRCSNGAFSLLRDDDRRAQRGKITPNSIWQNDLSDGWGIHVDHGIDNFLQNISI